MRKFAFKRLACTMAAELLLGQLKILNCKSKSTIAHTVTCPRALSDLPLIRHRSAAFDQERPEAHGQYPKVAPKRLVYLRSKLVASGCHKSFRKTEKQHLFTLMIDKREGWEPRNDTL